MQQLEAGYARCNCGKIAGVLFQLNTDPLSLEQLNLSQSADRPLDMRAVTNRRLTSGSVSFLSIYETKNFSYVVQFNYFKHQKEKRK